MKYLSVLLLLAATALATAEAQTCDGYGLWPSAQPAQTATDTRAVTLGVRFTASVDGHVCGIRFHGSDRTATLWASDGTLLAQAEAADVGDGWKQADFSGPVAITAGSIYVASYHAPNGAWSESLGYPFPHTSGALTAIEAVYRYGQDAFPAHVSSRNYWVDLVFAERAESQEPPMGELTAIWDRNPPEPPTHYYELEWWSPPGLWGGPVRVEGTEAALAVYEVGEYAARVKACNASGCSAWTESERVTVDPIELPPDPPSGMSITVTVTVQ